MVEIGKFNTLKVVKLVDFGVYLDGGNNVEILLPARYITSPLQEDDMVDVFIYTDSEDRLIATTETPLIQVGQFSYLTVKQTTPVGAFVDWGLAKDLLVPFSEQQVRMKVGATYLVYAYLDDNTKRIVASSKIGKFLGNTIPVYRKGDKVDILLYQKSDIGIKVIVDNLHNGIIYNNEIFRKVNIGDVATAFVKQVRPDGKIDVTLSDSSANRIQQLSCEIFDWLMISGGQSALSDKSDPEEIKKLFYCSKKDFKKAIGLLYKEKKITLSDNGIKLVIQPK